MARRGNLTALYKYHGVWGHADRLFKLKVRGARPHVGTNSANRVYSAKVKVAPSAGTREEESQRGHPQSPAALLQCGLGEAMAALGAFPAAPVSWEGLGCPGSTSALPGDSAHSSVRSVLGSPQTPAAPHPAATTSPCARPCVPPVQLQCNQCRPCGSRVGNGYWFSGLQPFPFTC